MSDPDTFRFPETNEIRPPEYPLDREAFDRALTTGHGRTLVHALRVGVEHFKDLILDAAIHCRFREARIEYNPCPPCPVSYFSDIQGWSLARLCMLAGVADEVVDVPIANTDRYSAYQWERIEEELVAAGHMPPPAAWSEIHSDWVERWQDRITADGEEGMIAVAEAFGEEILTQEYMGVWQVSDAVQYYDGLHGEGAAVRLLAPETARNRAIRRFVRVHRRNQLCMERSRKAEEEEMRDYQPAPPATIHDVLEFIHGKKNDGLPIRLFSKNATHEDRLRIQRVLYGSKESQVLQRALRCMCETGLPEFDPYLLSLVEHRDEDVRYFAGRVFQQHGRPEVREAAFSALARGDKTMAWELFHRSARNGDSHVLLEIFRSLYQDTEFPDPMHVFVAPLCIFKDNPYLTEPLLLVFVYEHSPCRVCRSEAFRFMMERGVCPDWVTEEAQWDAMPGIREMAAGGAPWPFQRPDQIAIIRQLHAAHPHANAETLSSLFGRDNRQRIHEIKGFLKTFKGLGQW